MAVRTIQIVSCDHPDHGEGCPKDLKPEVFRFFNPQTGEPFKLDACTPERAKLVKAIETLLAYSYLDEEEDTRLEEEKTEREDGIYLKGKEQGYHEGYEAAKEEASAPKAPDPRKPLYDAARAWSKEKTGQPVRGKISTTSEVVRKFLSSPEGSPWKEWEPGKSLPGTLEGVDPTEESEKKVIVPQTTFVAA